MTEHTTYRDEITSDFTLRIIVDDVSGGSGTEFRASIYDSELDLICDAWGDTNDEAISAVLKTYAENELTSSS